MRANLLRVGGLVVVALLATSALLPVAVAGVAVNLQDRVGTDGSAIAWTRNLEPVVLTVDQFAAFDGASIDDIFVYAYSGATWEQIPFQVDEIDGSGNYGSEDGLLDADDELVFMAMDMGEQATPAEWVDDADAQSQPRYEVVVANPLNPAEQGWVYVYRSTTLVPVYGDYVDWDENTLRITAGTYVAGYDDTHPGLEVLELHGGGLDVLDRSKLRVNVTCWIGPIPIEMTLNEDQVGDEWGGIMPDIDGAVRVGGGSTALNLWSYYSMYEGLGGVDVDAIDPVPPCTEIDLNWIRESTDWLDPASTGMAPATYFDDNTPTGVAVDGTPDMVPTAPPVSYQQISGALGSVVQVLDIQLDGGTLTNYYKDDSTPDSSDTGDQKSFGDAGFRVDTPTGQAVFALGNYILEAAQGNVGDLYVQYHNNPLEATTSEQIYEPPCEPVSGTAFSWEPETPLVGQTVTFTAEASGTEPIAFAWDFGDGDTGNGAVVTHEYAEAGEFTVTLTATNDCGEETVEQVITVEEECEPVWGTAFTWEPESPLVGQTVTFTGEASGTEPITFAWEFGDGETGNGAVVTHEYAAAGEYTVVLTATNDCGEETVEHVITVEEGCEPVSGTTFTWEPEIPLVGQVVTLTAEANGTVPIAFEWDLGDGATDVGEEVTHQYDEVGEYTVVLTATNDCGEETVSDLILVVDECLPVEGTAFTWEPETPEVGQVVTLTAEAVGTEPIGFAWDLGDGTLAEGEEITHEYAEAGAFTVVLTATNDCGEETVTEVLEVICDPLTGVDFVWQPSLPVVGEVTTFTADATGTEPITYEWEFGDDGSTETGNPVDHIFAMSGTFPVTVTAINPCGTAPPVVHTIQVHEPGAMHIVYLPLVLRDYPPPPCQDLVENGGFEDDSAWYIPITPRPARYTTDRAHSGSRSLLLGLKPGEGDKESYSSASQTVTLPASLHSATLSFWYYPVSDGDMGDQQDCLLQDADGTWHVLMRTNSNAATWIKMSYDLSAYAGQTVKVYFNGYNDGVGVGVAGFFLDDVSLEVCTEPVEPPPPPPPPDCYPAAWNSVQVGNTPHGVAVNSSANEIYATNYEDETLSVINGETYSLITTVPVANGPNAVAYNPANDRIYVANRDANTVTVIKGSDHSVVKAINVGIHPNGLAVNETTNRIYVANFGSDNVSVISAISNTVIQTLSVGHGPSLVAVNPNTNKAYVTLHGDGRVAVIDGAGSVSQIDIYGRTGPYGIAVDVQRNLAYVATIDTYSIVAIDGSVDEAVGYATVQRTFGGEPVPMRMIAVNPTIGTSGHVFVTTVGEDGGWNQILLLPKGWPEYFDQPRALHLNEGREGLAFDAATLRVLATSRTDDLVAVFLDGEPPCPVNFGQEYQIVVCVMRDEGVCEPVAMR